MNINVYMYIFSKYIVCVCVRACMRACVRVYIYIYNKYTQYTQIHYVNKNFYFGCD